MCFRSHEMTTFFDLLILCDSLGTVKNTRRSQWYMQETADAISRKLDLSVCILGCRGASFAGEVTYLDLLAEAPMATALMIQSAGNDFLMKADASAAVVRRETDLDKQRQADRQTDRQTYR